MTYDPNAGRFDTYQKAEAARLEAALCAADLVVGYNVSGFDYELLRPYTSHLLSEQGRSDGGPSGRAGMETETQGHG